MTDDERRTLERTYEALEFAWSLSHRTVHGTSTCDCIKSGTWCAICRRVAPVLAELHDLKGVPSEAS